MFELLFVHPVWAYRAGKLSLASAWPRWLLIALIVAAAVAVIVSLWRRRHLGWPRLALLGTLQTVLAALLLTLLWRPVLNVERVRDQQNVLAVLVDNSSSMAVRDTPERTRQQEATAAIKAPLEQLAKTFELRYFAFDNGTNGVDSLESLPPAGSQTRIGSALLHVMQTAGSVPLAGVVLLSDGAENAHSLTEANLREIAAFGVPVHTVGVGPERLEHDLELAQVDLPDSVAPGAIITADILVRHSLAAKASSRVRVYDGETLLAARELSLPADAARTADNQTRVRLEIPGGSAGVRDLRFALDALPDERNVNNNERRLVVNVPARRRNILYIEGEPRWEYKFIRRASEGQRSLRLVSAVRTTQNKLYRQGVASADELANGLPTTAKELFAYDAVIVGSFEAPAFTPAQHDLLKQFVDRRGGSVMLLAGRYGLGDGGWGNSALAGVLPMHLPTKRGNDFVQGAMRAELTTYGAESTLLRFDAAPERNLEQWRGLPDLANYQRLGHLKPGAVVLLEAMPKRDAAERGAQRSSERLPLLLWQRYGRGSAYVLATASTQRWQMSLPADDQRHEIFWRQLLHALADPAPSRAWLATDRTAYADERNVAFAAELRDEAFEALSSLGAAQMELSVQSENGPAQKLALTPSLTQPGRYEAAMAADASGLYRAELTARVADGQVLTANTAFRRDDNVVEHFDAYQHRAVLERIAADTRGRYWPLNQLDALGAAVPFTKSGIVERQMLDLWHLPAVFLLLLLLKLSEWLLRLKWGTL